MSTINCNELIVPVNDKVLIAQENAKFNTKIRDYMEKALAPGTIKFYKIDLRIFANFCLSMGFEYLPASPDTVAKFLIHLIDLGLKPSSLKRKLSAICMIHEANDYDSPTRHKGVKAVFNGIKREHGMAEVKKTPATAECITKMIACCPDTLLGHRDKILLLIGFAGALRRSELIALSVEDITYTQEGMKVLIKKSKSDQESKGTSIAIKNGEHFKVVDTLINWLKMADISEGFIFRTVKKNNKIGRFSLHTRDVSRIIKYYAKLAGFDESGFSGHSLRSGFITSGAQAGADIFKLMEVSRHKYPKEIMGYIREAKLFENHAGESFL